MATQTPVPAAIDQTTETAPRRLVFEVLQDWISTTDHKKIGMLYIGYSLVFLVIAGFEAVLMRIQLAFPNNHAVSPQAFNRLFTMHGTTMVFFVGMPILFGFGNYLVPLMIGARDMAFPRLNAFSFWISAFGGLLLYFSYIGGDGMYGAGSAPDVGWWAYAPLTAHAFSPGHSTDYWTLAVFLSGIGSVGTALNIVTTIISMRCPGMTMNRLPLLAWLYLSMSLLTFVAVGPLSAAQIMLMLDRYLGSHFFDAQAGGSAVLWMHFFWIFGHPEVYVLVMPAFGFASEIIPVFSRKAIFGYTAMVAASIGICFVSLSVWAHHMFTVGLGPAGNAFFTLSTMAIGVPTGIKIFNWLATIWGGKVHFTTAMLFAVAFLFQFMLAGLTGIMLSVAPLDWQLGGSYFVVAHFHFVLVGAILFMIFAAFYYWYPKMTGRLLNEKIGKWHFWIFLIGFHLCFDLMHIPGMLGMPRRIYTYEADRGWFLLNFLVSTGAGIQTIGTLIFVYNMVWSYFKGEIAGPDPWDAWTLEWATASPPPAYNFATTPSVASRRPLWDLKHPEDTDGQYE
ncbi:cytochrome c oxidase subunit 1 [Granulicella aggregans]|uniref:Cytochrome c oxidase subunit 1 n=1 Tax=Granulicella aggregans TaxID=474949 RepID=A0A7W7Z9G8_9BACT|nr:cytochrome c oxidase subunit I [Granulicella aggregans]MBB5055809.1 cytochrome c oxidase subunit 1 [Granulicella aggregans]